MGDVTDSEPVAPADSAGVLWAGRHLASHPRADDDGSAPAILIESLERFRNGQATVVEVVDVLRDSRLLVPLVAEVAADAGSNKRADLSIVTVAGPDGRAVLPVFSSTETMRHWNPDARPVPTDAVRIALAAVDDGTDLAVLDPTSSTEFAIRRPALWAIAQQRPWLPSFADPDVAIAFERSIAPEPDVAAVAVTPGDPAARLAAPELLITLTIRPGLDDTALATLLSRLQRAWAESTLIAERVDSLSLNLVPAS